MKRLTRDERLILREASKIKRRIQESVSVEDLSQEEMDALEAAIPFGGAAQPHVQQIVRGLEDRGLVEIVGRDSLDDSLFYELTPRGKELLKSAGLFYYKNRR